MSTVYTIESEKQILVEAGHLLPFVPMGSHVPLVQAARDVLDDGYVWFHLPYKDGLQGPFFDLLQSRYGVSARSAAEVRELTRLAGTLAYACERDRSGVISVVMFPELASRMDHDKSKLCVCNGSVLERLINKAVEMGDVVVHTMTTANEGQAAYNSRAMVCTPQLDALYAETRAGNRYVDLTAGWKPTLNRTTVKLPAGKWAYQYHDFANCYIKELRQLEADVSVINQNAHRGGVGCVWMGQFYPFSPRVVRYHMIFQKSVKLGGRMYAPIQNLRAAQRLDVTFMVNGQEVSAYEEDFSSLHPTMAYHRAGIVPPSNMYDFVTCEGLSVADCRQAVKLIINCALNCKEFRFGVAAAAMKFQSEEREHAHMERREARAVCRYVHAIAPHVYRAHEAILGPDQLGENTGKELQRIDSDIARHVLRQLGIANIPCISAHDSFVVPRTAADHLHELMVQAYQHTVGHVPQTKAMWLENGVEVKKPYPVDTGVVLAQVLVTAEAVAKHSGRKKEAPTAVAPAPLPVLVRNTPVELPILPVEVSVSVPEIVPTVGTPAPIAATAEARRAELLAEIEQGEQPDPVEAATAEEIQKKLLSWPFLDPAVAMLVGPMLVTALGPRKARETYLSPKFIKGLGKCQATYGTGPAFATALTAFVNTLA